MASRLTKAQKIMIVTELACFEKATVVRDKIKAEFGIELAVTSIKYYDPTIWGDDHDLAKKWRDMFEVARTKFLKDCARVPVMNKSYRARELQKILDMEIERQNTVGARDTLKQAAEEEGGVFTNRRELTGKDGGPIETLGLNLDDLDEAQLLALAESLAKEKA